MSRVKSDRYNVSGLIEAQFEPGSHRRVLRNLLGITSKRRMDQAEAKAYLRALAELIAKYDQRHRFTAGDVRIVHKLWLRNVYAWAGQYRQVNISKGAFPFAAAKHIPRLMDALEQGPLRRYTPCRFTSTGEIAQAIAIVHTELVLIHPFRDGNGRAARLLAILMGLQAGLPPFNFGGITGRRRQAYFAAVQAGMREDYQPMERIFTDVIERTLRLHAGKPRG